jgi:hypothetical protein
LHKAIYYLGPGKCLKYLTLPYNWPEISFVLVNMLGILVQCVYADQVYHPRMLDEGEDGRAEIRKLHAGTLCTSGVTPKQFCIIIRLLERTGQIKSNAGRLKSIRGFEEAHSSSMTLEQEFSICGNKFLMFMMEVLHPLNGMYTDLNLSPVWR